MKNTWKQWDDQERARLRALELAEQDRNYIDLNNLYLAVERRSVKLSITVSNQLRVLATRAYDHGDPMVDWWGREFLKLPDWNKY